MAQLVEDPESLNRSLELEEPTTEAEDDVVSTETKDEGDVISGDVVEFAKPFICYNVIKGVKCNKKFKQKQQLSRHHRQCVHKLRYLCPTALCGLHYGSKQHLARHTASNTCNSKKPRRGRLPASITTHPDFQCSPRVRDLKGYKLSSVRKLTRPNLRFIYKHRDNAALKGKVAAHPRLSLVQDEEDDNEGADVSDIDSVGEVEPVLNVAKVPLPTSIGAVPLPTSVASVPLPPSDAAVPSPSVGADKEADVSSSNDNGPLSPSVASVPIPPSVAAVAPPIIAAVTPSSDAAVPSPSVGADKEADVSSSNDNGPLSPSVASVPIPPSVAAVAPPIIAAVTPSSDAAVPSPSVGAHKEGDVSSSNDNGTVPDARLLGKSPATCIIVGNNSEAQPSEPQSSHSSKSMSGKKMLRNSTTVGSRQSQRATKQTDRWSPSKSQPGQSGSVPLPDRSNKRAADNDGDEEVAGDNDRSQAHGSTTAQIKRKKLNTVVSRLTAAHSETKCTGTPAMSPVLSTDSIPLSAKEAVTSECDHNHQSHSAAIDEQHITSIDRRVEVDSASSECDQEGVRGGADHQSQSAANDEQHTNENECQKEDSNQAIGSEFSTHIPAADNADNVLITRNNNSPRPSVFDVTTILTEADDVCDVYSEGVLVGANTIVSVDNNGSLLAQDSIYKGKMAACGVTLDGIRDLWVGNEATRKSARIRNPHWRDTDNVFVERNYVDYALSVLESGLSEPCIEKRLVPVSGVYAGYGVFSTEKLRPSQPCALYTGQLYHSEDKVKLMEAEMNDAGNADKAVYTIQVESVGRGRANRFFVVGHRETVILGCMINHSKNAGNVRPLVVWDDDTPHVVFVARKFIPANTELLYCYNIEDRNYESQFPWYGQ